MNDSPQRQQPDPSAGLCASCHHAAVVVTDRARVYVRCLRSVGDPRFARYPVLPVLVCRGHDVRKVG